MADTVTLGGGGVDGYFGKNPDWSKIKVKTGRTIWSSYDDNTLQAWLVEDTNSGGVELAVGNYANPIQIAGNGLPRIAGYFASGFVFENPNQVGIDASGNSWQYVGTSPLPYTVTAGTDPTASSDYEKVFESTLQNLNGLEQPSDLDKVIVRTRTSAQAIAENAPVGTRYVITNFDDARYDVVDSGDLGGFYIDGLASGARLKLFEKGEMSAGNYGYEVSDGKNISTLISHFYQSPEVSTLKFKAGAYSFDETWPYAVDNKRIVGVKNLTTFNYTGSSGTEGNLVKAVKLRKLTDTAVVNSEFSGVIIDLGSATYVQGVDCRYYTRQSLVGDIKVYNGGVGCEKFVIDKLYYTNFGPLSLRNDPLLKIGSGLVIRGTVDSLASTNAIHIPDLISIGHEHGILIDTLVASISTLRISGSVEACENAVTYTDGVGVLDANFDLHMEGNERNVNWIGVSLGGAGNITWEGAWNNSAGGSIHVGSSSHYFNTRLIGAIDYYGFNNARSSFNGASPTTHSGESGTENGVSVTYKAPEEVKAFPSWRPSRQAYVSTTNGDYSKSSSASTFSNTTTYTDFDFSDDINLLSGYGVVEVSASYLRSDGSRKVFTAIAQKRSSDTNFLITQTGGDTLDANFDVQLTGSLLGRVKSGINENILYSFKVSPF